MILPGVKVNTELLSSASANSKDGFGDHWVASRLKAEKSWLGLLADTLSISMGGFSAFARSTEREFNGENGSARGLRGAWRRELWFDEGK